LRIARGAGSFTLHEATALKLFELRIARGAGSFTLSGRGRP